MPSTDTSPSASEARLIDLIRGSFVARGEAYLSERDGCVKAPLSNAVLLDHLYGRERIGAYSPEKAPFVCFDFDGKNLPDGADEAWGQLLAVAGTIDADVGLPPLLPESSRSGLGYHAWLFFDADDRPTLEDVKHFSRLVLQVAHLPHDEDESRGHVGIYPHTHGPKGFGKTPYLPWAGLLGGSATARFMGLADRMPLDRQESALEDVQRITATRLARAIRDLEAMVGAEPTEPTVTKTAGIVVGHPSVLVDPRALGRSRHDVLRGEVMRLRSFLPMEETRAIAFALAGQYGLLAENRGGEVESLVIGAYLRPAIEVVTEFERVREAGNPIPAAINLYDSSIVPRMPEFTVKNFLRRIGLHLVWAPPGGLKTWTLLTWLHELLADTGTGRICGHPDLWINRRYKRVLWIATEEEPEVLRYKAEMVLRGLDLTGLDGELRYLFAANGKRRITLDDLPAIIEAEGPLDAIVLDSLTGLRPKVVNGERVKWDVDNDAANEVCLRLRQLAAEHALAFHMVHHTGRDTKKGYRGATDWWASADVMMGFVPESTTSKVVVEKNRDGRIVAPFLLEPAWSERAFTLTYSSAPPSQGRKMTPTALKVMKFFIELQGKHKSNASQKEIIKVLGGSRGTVIDAIQLCVDERQLHDTGLKAGNSPIYGYGAKKSELGRNPDSEADSGDDE